MTPYAVRFEVRSRVRPARRVRAEVALTNRQAAAVLTWLRSMHERGDIFSYDLAPAPRMARVAVGPDGRVLSAPDFYDEIVKPIFGASR